MANVIEISLVIILRWLFIRRMLFEIIMQALHVFLGIGPTRSAMYDGGCYNSGKRRCLSRLVRTSCLNIGLWHGHKPSTALPSVGPTTDFIESLRLESTSASHDLPGRLVVRTVPSDTPLRLALTLLRTRSRLRSRVIGTCRRNFSRGVEWPQRRRYIPTKG